MARCGAQQHRSAPFGLLLGACQGPWLLPTCPLPPPRSERVWQRFAIDLRSVDRTIDPRGGTRDSARVTTARSRAPRGCRGSRVEAGVAIARAAAHWRRPSIARWWPSLAVRAAGGRGGRGGGDGDERRRSPNALGASRRRRDVGQEEVARMPSCCASARSHTAGEQQQQQQQPRRSDAGGFVGEQQRRSAGGGWLVHLSAVRRGGRSSSARATLHTTTQPRETQQHYERHWHNHENGTDDKHDSNETDQHQKKNNDTPRPRVARCRIRTSS